MDDLLNWIAKREYCRRSGTTDGQIRGRIQRRQWQPGTHYQIIGRTMYINWREVETWISNQASSGTAAVSASDSSTTACGISDTSTSPGTKGTAPRLHVVGPYTSRD